MIWPMRSDEELLGNFWVYFQPGFEEDITDSAIAIDIQISNFRRDGRLEAVTALIDGLSEGARTEKDAVRVLDYHVGMSGLPDGTGYRAWLLAVQARLHEALRDPAVVPDDLGSPRLFLANGHRCTWFPDPDLQNVVADAVLDMFEEQGRIWVEDPAGNGWRRQHYYADLSALRATIGDIGLTAPYTEINRTTTPDPERTEPATGAVVVLNMGFHTGEISGLAAYPERSLDTALREAFPDLCHWFGGFFYQGAAPPMDEMGAACRSTQDPARSRVREQLTMLLHEDDDMMRRVVEACGSYVLPKDLRHWVDRTLWRLDAFDWLGPNGELLTE